MPVLQHTAKSSLKMGNRSGTRGKNFQRIMPLVSYITGITPYHEMIKSKRKVRYTWCIASCPFTDHLSLKKGKKSIAIFQNSIEFHPEICFTKQPELTYSDLWFLPI
ncbi:MAG: hypothetical protein B6D35_07440 [Candidatus Brocadia sp. UTAMX2]|nr:MAG: hypothetical protein B6D35_07440 [Candidatus Brocadia sp. UTAMX2]